MIQCTYITHVVHVNTSYMKFVVIIMCMYMCSVFLQKDLMAILISQTEVRQADLKSSILTALQGDTQMLHNIEEWGSWWLHYLPAIHTQSQPHNAPSLSTVLCIIKHTLESQHSLMTGYTESQHSPVTVYTESQPSLVTVCTESQHSLVTGYTVT